MPEAAPPEGRQAEATGQPPAADGAQGQRGTLEPGIGRGLIPAGDEPAAPGPTAKPTPPEAADPATTHLAVGEEVKDAFPNAKLNQHGDTSEWSARLGDKMVYVGPDDGPATIRIDFEDTARRGVAKSLQGEGKPLEFARALKDFVSGVAEKGMGVEFRAIDSERPGGNLGVLNTRADIYARVLRKAGYELVGDGPNAQGYYKWRPKQGEAPAQAKPAEALTTQSAPPAERSPWRSKYEELLSQGVGEKNARGLADILHPEGDAAPPAAKTAPPSPPAAQGGTLSTLQAQEAPTGQQAGRERLLDRMRRQAQGQAPLTPRPGEPVLQARGATVQPEALTAPEREAERQFAQTKYTDIPSALRDRVEAVVQARQAEGGNPESLRQTARSAFAAGGHEGLSELLALQEARLRPPEAAAPENLRQSQGDLDRGVQEFNDEVARAARQLQRSGLLKEAVRRRVAEHVRQTDEDAAAAGAGEAPAGTTAPAHAGREPAPGRGGEAAGNELTAKSPEPVARDQLAPTGTRTPREALLDAISSQPAEWMGREGPRPSTAGSPLQLIWRLWDRLKGDMTRKEFEGELEQLRREGKIRLVSIGSGRDWSEEQRGKSILRAGTGELMVAVDPLDLARSPKSAPARGAESPGSEPAAPGEGKVGGGPAAPKAPAAGGETSKGDRLNRSRVEARYKPFFEEVQGLGLDMDALHGRAKEILQESRSGGSEGESIRRTALQELQRRGISQNAVRRAEDANGIKGLDDIAAHVVGEDALRPLMRRGESDPTEALFRILKEGKRQRLSEEAAYEKARDLMYQEKVDDATKKASAQGLSERAAADALRAGEVEAEGASDRRPGEPTSAERGDADDRGVTAGSTSEVEPGVEFIGRRRNPGAAAPVPAGQPAGQQRGAGSVVGPHEINATIRKLFDLPVYVEGQLQAQAEALYRRKPEAAEMNKMDLADSPALVHELAHHLAKTKALNLDPTALPREVFEGLRQFDYEPARADLKTGMREGFAEFLRLRETDGLHNLTREQQAAAGFAERMLASRPGVIDKLDRVRELFRQYGRQSASEQFAGHISPTGKAAQAQVRPGEAAADYLGRTANAAADNLLDDALPAKRAERAAEARGEKFAPGTKLSEVIATTRLRNIPDAHEMEQGGVFAYDADGKHTTLSMPLREAVKGLSAEEVAPGGELDRYMHALRVLHDVSTDAVQRSPEHAQGARALIEELMKGDPQKFRRLEQAAQNVTNIFNASLDAMALAGRITSKRAAELKKLHPFYVSEQHITEPDFRGVSPYGGRRRGEEPRSASFLKHRTGSGEQMVNWLDALRDRYRFTAAAVNDQARFGALLDLSKREGVGHWLNPGEPGAGPAGEPKGWPMDGTKPSITGYVNGEPVRIRVNDRPFYELATGTQGEGDRAHALFKAIGDVAQMTRILQIERVGFTVLAPVWNLKNLVRDPILYAMRTAADKGTIRNLADYYAWVGKGINFYSRALLAGGAEHVDVSRASDHYFKLLERMSGRELDWGAVTGEKSFSSRVIDGWHGLLQRISDVVTAQEKSTRVLEMKNVLDRLGWTQERIAAEMKRDPAQRNPIPFADQVAALDVASQITHNVHQQGVLVRQLNRSTPFLGAHIAGVYKDVATFATQPKKVAGALTLLAIAKAVEFALNKDDREWRELPPNYRLGFNFKTPLGWMHLPAPRGISGVITGMMDSATRASSDNDPRFGQIVKEALGEIAPHGGPEPAMTAWRVGTNRDYFGRPIIPDKQADRMGVGERFLDPAALKYQASQYSGGILDPKRLNVNPFHMDQHPHQSVYDFKESFNDAEKDFAREEAAKRRVGLKAQVPPALRVMRQTDAAIKKLEAAYHNEKVTDKQQGEIRSQQVALARRALSVSKPR